MDRCRRVLTMSGKGGTLKRNIFRAHALTHAKDLLEFKAQAR